MLRRYEGWHPIVRDLIEAFPETFIWALHDRAELPQWTESRITLLGDACHPMLPFMAQGACQAIEDAAVLTRCIHECGGAVREALVRYEAARCPRASGIQARSWDNCTTYHLPDGDAQRARDASYASAVDRGSALGAFDWLYGHDASSVPLPA